MFWFPCFIAYMHIASPEGHEYVVSAVLKQNGKDKYLLSYPGKNFMAKLFFCLFVFYYFMLVLILLNFFSDFK